MVFRLGCSGVKCRRPLTPFHERSDRRRDEASGRAIQRTWTYIYGTWSTNSGYDPVGVLQVFTPAYKPGALFLHTRRSAG